MMLVVVADLMQKVGWSVKVFAAESGRQALRSKAAATSLMQCLRKQVHSAGLKRKHQSG